VTCLHEFLPLACIQNHVGSSNEHLAENQPCLSVSHLNWLNDPARLRAFLFGFGALFRSRNDLDLSLLPYDSNSLFSHEGAVGPKLNRWARFFC
jgi:hypothetical protein